MAIMRRLFKTMLKSRLKKLKGLFFIFSYVKMLLHSAGAISAFLFLQKRTMRGDK